LADSEQSSRAISYIRALAFSSLILSICFIAFAFISIGRLQEIHSPSFPVCLVRETVVYRSVHNLCVILPSAAVLCGILALIRIYRRGRKGYEFILSLAGMGISTVAFIIYVIRMMGI